MQEVDEGMKFKPKQTIAERAAIARAKEAEENARRGSPMPEGYDKDEDSKLVFEMSKKMNSRLNAGYTIVPNYGLSTSKDAYVYEEDELDPVDKTHFRKRDTFSQYVEAEAKFSLLIKQQKNSG